MRSERGGHTLDATGVVHEAYLRLAGSDLFSCQDPNHFMSLAARTIRRVLVDHARARNRLKRGGDATPVTLHSGVPGEETQAFDVLALNDALAKLADESESLVQVVELRFFGGLTIEQTSAVLGIGATKVNRLWRAARAWLREEMLDSGREPDSGLRSGDG